MKKKKTKKTTSHPLTARGSAQKFADCGGVFGPRGEDEQGPVKGEPEAWEDVMCVNVMVRGKRGCH